MQRSVLDYLEQSAEKFPDRTVFADNENKVTYREFQAQAKAVATGLAQRLNMKTNQPVVVLIERKIESLRGFFGVIYSGNFYAPVDYQMPAKRIELMIETLKPAAVMVTDTTRRVMEQITYDGNIVSLQELTETAVEQGMLDEIARRQIDTDPLYAMFTSGSTGVPKGVLVSHRSVIDLIDNFKDEFGFDETMILGNQAPFDFDVSVKDIYSTLKNGGTMYVIPKMMFSMVARLIDYLNEKQINTVIWATSALRIVENLNVFSKKMPRYLRTVMFSGEVMPNKVLNYWRKYLPEVMFVNLYGPTEITCNCTFYKVDRPFADEEALPIGIAFKNTDLFLLDGDRKNEVEPGQVGEICVRGSSLALGYYNNEERTREAFIQNPLNPMYPETIYCTGDLAQYAEDGNLMFVSRKDYQIKHMGHRIELSEVEIAVNALPFVEAACCIYDTEEEKIVLFYQAAERCDRELLKQLGKNLPKYMFPNRLEYFEKLPLNKNAKIDRTWLKENYILN
ncbi:MAG: amino acid adenylation domain-containing protein [Lachnospiraceae bacterium]|nr:amino acid adenylation domain-containing protein [Lachnospiraceae bacterium]